MSRELYQGYIDGLKPNAIVNVCDWMQKNWKLTSGGSAEPGDWRVERVPYMRQILDWLSSNSPVQKVVVIKPVQYGVSEGAIGWLGSTIDIDPSSAMYVLPTVDLAEEHNKTKFIPALESNLRIADKLVRSVGRQSGTSVSRIVFRGGSIKFTGANSEAGTRNKSIRYFVGDDLNGWPSELGEIGDTVSAFEDRTTAFPNNKKILLISTPTITIDGGSTGLIEREYSLSSRAEYYIPCPECDQFFVLKFEHLIYQSEGSRRIGEVSAACPHCGGIIPEYKRMLLANKGKYIEEFPDIQTKGVQIPFGLSPFVKWEKIVDKYLEANEAYIRGDISKMRTFTNNQLGQTWKDKGNKISIHEIAKRAEDYPVIVPRAACLLTAGIDMQHDCFKIEVVAWGRDDETWSIDYKTIWGNPAQPQVWAELETFLQQRYDYADTGRKIPILYTCIDTGGTKADGAEFSNTAMAYKFIKGKESRKIFGIKGMSTSGFGKITGKPSIIPVDIINKDKRFGEVMLFPVYTDIAKDTVANRLLIHTTGPGYMHFPTRYDDEYYEGLLSERKGDDGKWKKKRANIRNEPLDCRVYNLAARDIFPFDFNEWADNWDKQFTS